MACLDVIQKEGTPDIEFALIRVLTWLRIGQGESYHAREGTHGIPMGAVPAARTSPVYFPS